MPHARFIQGSTMRHIMVMSVSGAIGITALFVVDMLDLFFLSLLGEKHLAAAVGYAGTILFLTTSLGIGLSIATGALVSRAVGQRDTEQARRHMVNITALTIIVSAISAVIIWLAIPSLLTLVGATGEVHRLAEQYLNILVPSMPLLAVAMSFGAGLRAVGDAHLSMVSTLAGGAVNAIFDPILIFAMNLDIEGAAIASVLARCTILGISAWGMMGKHRLFGQFNLNHFYTGLNSVLKIAVPAVATNLAMPVSNAFVTRIIAQYGDGFVAGYAIVGRIIPVAFGVIFALSGAIGPIIGQNYGASLLPRVRQSLKDAFLFTAIYVLAISLGLFLLQDVLIKIFSARGNAAELITFFCSFIAVGFVFNGWLFVANASFNNLGKAGFSTLLNWGKATLGTLPFVWIGSLYQGAYGVLLGQVLGNVLFGILAVILSFRLIGKIESIPQIKAQVRKTTPEPEEEVQLPCPFNPLSSECSQMAQMAEEAECEELGYKPELASNSGG